MSNITVGQYLDMKQKVRLLRMEGNEDEYIKAKAAVVWFEIELRKHLRKENAPAKASA